jgi:SAM-dependent methyltransferase
VGYDERFFRRRMKKYHAKEVALARALWTELHPRSVADVGCALGSYLCGFLECGVRERCLVGYERSAKQARKFAPREIRGRIFELDAGAPREPRTRFDLVLCIEVAEHLPEACANVLVQNLAGLVNRNGAIAFTAAGVGQDGTGHVNCQPREYWIARALAVGLKVDLAREATVKNCIASAGDPLDLLKNLSVFRQLSPETKTP